MIAVNIQYCDDIIRHADNLRYSLIGVYSGICMIPEQEFVLARISLNISFSAPASEYRPHDMPIIVETVKNNERVSSVQLTPPEDLPAEAQGIFYGLVHHSIEHLPVADGDTLNARLFIGGQLLAEGNPLQFRFMPPLQN